MQTLACEALRLQSGGLCCLVGRFPAADDGNDFQRAAALRKTDSIRAEIAAVLAHQLLVELHIAAVLPDVNMIALRARDLVPLRIDALKPALASVI